MPYGSGTGGYYLPRATNRVTSPYVTPGNRGKQTPGTNANPNLYNPVASQNKPGTNPRVDWLDQNMPEWRNATGGQQTQIANALWGNGDFGGYPQMPGLNSLAGSRSGGGRGGGGGGGAAPVAGLSQEELDWLMGQIGKGRPQDLTASVLDLPDPRQFFGNFDTSQYDTARQGVQQGIEGIRGRANTAYDAAKAQLDQFVNPYSSAAWAQTPGMSDRMNAMFAANGVPTSINADTLDQGVQADRAFGNVMALMGANEQARQAANLRANAADRATTEQNLGLEGNMLNLGVNMAQAKGKSAWDQMLSQLGFDTASQEAVQNWARGNTVADTNVANKNAWNQGLLGTFLQMIGAKQPGLALTLPTDTAGYYA